MSPDDPRHGTTAGFHSGCRELCCRRAYARYEKRGKIRRARGETWAIPALGAQRRIRALIRLGWTSTDIAAAAGWNDRNYVLRILHGQSGRPCQWVERKTHAAIADVYERLSMVIPPHAPHRARSRSMAEKKGWPPPLAWENIDDPDEQPTRWEYRARHAKDATPDNHVDPVVVMRLLEGDRVPATKAEKEAAMEQWVADGGSQAELARWHGWRAGRYTTHLRVVGEAS